MRIRRKTAVVVQTHQLTTVRLKGQQVRAWCVPCRAEVLMLTPDEAAALAQSTARRIYRHVEAGELHCMETDEGALRVCVNSLGGITPATVTNVNTRSLLRLSENSNPEIRKVERE